MEEDGFTQHVALCMSISVMKLRRFSCNIMAHSCTPVAGATRAGSRTVWNILEPIFEDVSGDQIW